MSVCSPLSSRSIAQDAHLPEGVGGAFSSIHHRQKKCCFVFFHTEATTDDDRSPFIGRVPMASEDQRHEKKRRNLLWIFLSEQPQKPMGSDMIINDGRFFMRTPNSWAVLFFPLKKSSTKHHVSIGSPFL